MSLRNKDLSIQEMFQAGSSNSGAFIVEDIANNLIFSDKVFSISKRLTYASSATFDIILDPTGCTCDFVVFLPIFLNAYGAGPINIDLYIGATYDDATGTEIESINRNNESTAIAKTKVYLSPTVSNSGTKLPVEFIILSNGTAATATAGGAVKEDLTFNAKKDQVYMLRITNTEASAASGSISANWFEL
jgi:hypothetical protein